VARANRFSACDENAKPLSCVMARSAVRRARKPRRGRDTPAQTAPAGAPAIGGAIAAMQPVPQRARVAPEGTRPAEQRPSATGWRNPGRLCPPQAWTGNPRCRPGNRQHAGDSAALGSRVRAIQRPAEIRRVSPRISPAARVTCAWRSIAASRHAYIVDKENRQRTQWGSSLGSRGISILGRGSRPLPLHLPIFLR